MAAAQLSETKRRLLEKMLRSEATRQSWAEPLPERVPGEPVPLAPAQRQIWLHSQMAPDLPLYNEPVFVHFRGSLDHAALEQAFNEILRRHEIWRSGFAPVGGEIVQAIYDHYHVEIPFIDLWSDLRDIRAAESEMLRMARTDVLKVFDLSVGPLIRPKLFRIAGDDYRMHLAIHHIIMDGVSLNRVFLPELAALYRAFTQGRPSPLEPPKYQYAHYAIWQKRLLSNDSLTGQREFWRRELSGELPVLELPASRPRPPVTSHRGGQEAFRLSAATSEKIHAFVKREGVSAYILLLAAFKTLLFRYTQQEDILVGSIADGRDRAEFTNLMGYFLSTIVLRTRPSAGQTFRRYLEAVKQTVLTALANAGLPFDEIVRQAAARRDPSRHPLFQAMFSMRPPEMHGDHRWKLTQLDIPTGTAKFDLHLSVEEDRSGFAACFLYSTDLFDAEFTRRMSGHWITLLEAALDHPDTELGRLPLLPASEKRELEILARRPADVARGAVHQWFEAQAARTPRAIAVESDGVRLTYSELNQEANRLARRLREQGAQVDSVVALRMARSCSMIVGVLAILKAGAAYLPIDPALPEDRQVLLLEEGQAKVLLTSRGLPPLPAPCPVVFCHEGSGTSSNLDLEVSPDHLAYVLFTSGSTGKPKGVEVRHGGLSNLIAAMARELNLRPRGRFLALTTLSFDIAAVEIFVPLISRGQVVLLTHEEAQDPALLIERARETSCEAMQATPATWRSLIEAGWSGDPHLKVITGGEALTRELADALLDRCGSLWNGYGPTETTVYSTLHKVTRSAGPVPIGTPVANTELFVLDRNRELVPRGVPGELYIGGAGLARGYRHQPQMTEERFVTVSACGGRRLYRTGDLVRWNRQRELEYLGRTDDQVKIRGFRIEPGEIEAALARHPAVRGAAVRAWPDASGNQSLAAYIVAGSRENWREFLAHKLPSYMIPSHFIQVDSLPLTASGKVDRKSLPKPAGAPQRAESRGPSDGLERGLCRLWQSLLGLHAVGVQDSFFDLGGHSLLVARLVREIELEFGTRLPLAAVFESPTVERLAAVIRGRTGDTSLPRTIPIRAAGDRAPLFWINAGPSYRPLADLLEQGRPFLGVSLEPAEVDALPEHPSLEEIAVPLVRIIRQTQPHGPYHIGGFCASGMLAYEIAVQLEQSGERVATLLLLETFNYEHYFRIPKVRLWSSKLQHAVHRFRTLESPARWRYVAERVRGALRRLQPQPSHSLRDRKLFPAAWNYHPRPLRAQATVIQAEHRPRILDLAESWARMPLGGLEIHQVPGEFNDHRSTYQGENAAYMAALIDDCLRRAEQRAPEPEWKVVSA
jgi:amino acid adenylation domain-containing protein